MEGERILLRNLNENDANAVFAYRSLPEVAKYQYWEPFTWEKTLLFIKEYSNPNLDTSSKWNALAIVLKEKHELIGDCALKIVADKAEIGCTISPKFQHHGFAKETLGLIIDSCFKNMSVDEVSGITDSENIASIRLMESLNMLKLPDFEEKMMCKGCMSTEHKYVVKNPFLSVKPASSVFHQK